MSNRTLDLIRRIAARPPPRVVSSEEFLAIACNRCGACCEEIFVPDGPEGIAAEVDNPTLTDESRRFLAGLIPVRQLSHGWLYRCRHFRRDPEGVGTCAIYEDRPAACRGFPGGHPVRTWSQCSWYVEVCDASGTATDRLHVRSREDTARESAVFNGRRTPAAMDCLSTEEATDG